MKYAGLLFINIAFTFAGIFAARGLNEKIKVSRLLIEMADMMAAMLSFSADNSVKIIHSLATETSLSKLTFLKNIDFENKSINIEKNNLIVFHLSLNITSEICKQFSNGEIYPSYISMLCRQIIEQICFIKEVKNENINLQLIVESALESYNKQLGAKSLNIQELNDNNKGEYNGWASPSNTVK